MIENKEKLSLRGMPEDEALEIFKAWMREERLEYFDSLIGKWMPKITGSAISLARAYRIPSRPPSFDNWHLLPDWARFIAQGQNGGVFIFENEPDKAKKFWLTVDGEAMEITGFRIGYDPGTCGWENSMIEKPEGV